MSAFGKDVRDVVVDADGKEIKFVMADGSSRLISSDHSVPGMAEGVTVEAHVQMALASALLTLHERVAALEAKLEECNAG